MVTSAFSDAEIEFDRVVERLRSMPLTRIASHAPAARSLAQELADRCASLNGDVRREVPDVGDIAVGDQVAVTGRDLLASSPAEPDRAWMAGRLRDFRLSL